MTIARLPVVIDGLPLTSQLEAVVDMEGNAHLDRAMLSEALFGDILKAVDEDRLGQPDVSHFGGGNVELHRGQLGEAVFVNGRRLNLLPNAYNILELLSRTQYIGRKVLTQDVELCVFGPNEDNPYKIYKHLRGMLNRAEKGMGNPDKGILQIGASEHKPTLTLLEVWSRPDLSTEQQ